MFHQSTESEVENADAAIEQITIAGNLAAKVAKAAMEANCSRAYAEELIVSVVKNQELQIDNLGFSETGDWDAFLATIRVILIEWKRAANSALSRK